ncbi:MAG TPA: XdhC family protein [Candidatus Cybelea sp.]
MREVFATAARWFDEGRTFALATLVTLREAATAPIGTTIAVDAGGRIVGNIGTGCHESEIVEAAQQTARDGRTRRLDINLTIEDEIFAAPGCGAIMQVVTWLPEPAFAEEARAIAAGDRSTYVAFEYVDSAGARQTFRNEYPPKESLILIGATALAAELATIAPRSDFNVIVVDPRPSFATKERLGEAAEIVRKWPQEYLPSVLSERTHIVMISHDPKFDLPALRCALRSNAPYIGLLGSRRSQAARRASLAQDGFDEGALARIHGPAGLDLGGATVAETALSILAEIVANRHERLGEPLRTTSREIHRRADLLAKVRNG